MSGFSLYLRLSRLVTENKGQRVQGCSVAGGCSQVYSAGSSCCCLSVAGSSSCVLLTIWWIECLHRCLMPKQPNHWVTTRLRSTRASPRRGECFQLHNITDQKPGDLLVSAPWAHCKKDTGHGFIWPAGEILFPVSSDVTNISLTWRSEDVLADIPRRTCGDDRGFISSSPLRLCWWLENSWFSFWFATSLALLFTANVWTHLSFV